MGLFDKFRNSKSGSEESQGNGKNEISSCDDIGWEEKPVDTARRKRSISVLKEKGIPFLPQLYVIVPESEAKPRTVVESCYDCIY